MFNVAGLPTNVTVYFDDHHSLFHAPKGASKNENDTT